MHQQHTTSIYNPPASLCDDVRTVIRSHRCRFDLDDAVEERHCGIEVGCPAHLDQCDCFPVQQRSSMGVVFTLRCHGDGGGAIRTNRAQGTGGVHVDLRKVSQEHQIGLWGRVVLQEGLDDVAGYTTQQLGPWLANQRFHDDSSRTMAVRRASTRIATGSWQ
jgi:hypothetical protein